jgi:DNA (cytosine-5)-methyltransferase 1
MIENVVTQQIVADILSVSKATLKSWEASGKLRPLYEEQGKSFYRLSDLDDFEPVRRILNSRWREESLIRPSRVFTSVELFAGAGGLALGLENAGFHHLLVNEIDRDACKTLRYNRNTWNIVESSVHTLNLTKYKNIDLISGGFPCQAFSYAGKKLGFEDTRGTLFFEFARLIKEAQPKLFLGENVRGLASHDDGRTIKSICSILDDLGYEIVPPQILKAIFYRVPQKRERLFIVGIRRDLSDQASFTWPSPYHRIVTLRDALKAGELYASDAPASSGQVYPCRKREILSYVPPGGYWRDLPDKLQREYMKKSYFLGGGKTGMARRLSWHEPSLTLTCSPAQKQTERCHPEETRPLTVREYARIQTFPDDWGFMGSLSSQYRQIGNAVPVNLALAVGRKLVDFLNSFYATQADIDIAADSIQLTNCQTTGG